MIWLLAITLFIVLGGWAYDVWRSDRDYRQLLEKHTVIVRLYDEVLLELEDLKLSYRVLSAVNEERKANYAKVLSRAPNADGVFFLRAHYALDAIEIQGELGSAWDALAEVEACLKGDRDTELGITA